MAIPRKTKAKLTPKEDRFVENIALGRDKRESAIAAGYSKASAHSTATDTLSKPKIQAALEERKAYYRSIADVVAKDVIGAHQEMAFASIEDALDDKGFLDFPKAKKNGAAKLIKKISRQQTKYGETVSVEFYPRTEALAQLTEILGLKKQAGVNPNDMTVLAAVYQRLIDAGYTKEKGMEQLRVLYPDVDVKELGIVG